MLENYKALFDGGQGEIIEKKSKFIATTKNVETEEEAIAFIESMKKKYWDATHNCFAFSVGVKRVLNRCSDDGEPSGTAGKPILEVILGEEIHNIVVVVTRYFGGTLLGTGGLVRAYTKSAKEGIRNSIVIEKNFAERIFITTNYNDIGKIQYILNIEKIFVINTDYTDIVKIEILVKKSQVNNLKKKLIEATSARIVIEEIEQVYYGIVEGELIIF